MIIIIMITIIIVVIVIIIHFLKLLSHDNEFVDILIHLWTPMNSEFNFK